MFRSLRFRLPALFLAGIVLAVLIATVLALRLFQQYAREQAVKELQREAVGISTLFVQRAAYQVPGPRLLELMTGDRIYYVGDRSFDIFLNEGAAVGLRRLPQNEDVDIQELPHGVGTVFEFEPPDDPGQTYLAVARPLDQANVRLGAIVVAKPRSDVQERWLTLLQRLTLALAGALVVASALGVYLSRRISEPLRALSRAADEVAAGRYDVNVPKVGGRDEMTHLSDRFREMAAQLAAANERERNFLMSVSHELRTPLTAIRGHVDALREGVVEDPELATTSLDIVAFETDRLSRLVGDILDLAKLDAHRFTLLQEEVDMEALCDRAYTAFTEEARRRAIEYRRDVNAHPVIVTDGDRVLQIISNLLQNAFRWTPDGGRIELTLEQSNGSIRVAVDDTGPGIGEEERERIFRPFVSRDGAGGTGLGLAIARELANALGGTIELRSEPGRGSRFELVLPS